MGGRLVCSRMGRTLFSVNRRTVRDCSFVSLEREEGRSDEGRGELPLMINIFYIYKIRYTVNIQVRYYADGFRFHL